jgi:acetyltransferase-like isoleucine patch superfamily enzyme
MISTFILRIKRRDNVFYAFLYKLAKWIRSFHIPTIKIIHLPLYYFDYSIKVLAARIVQIFWSVPLFRARCETAGRNLHLPNGIPLIVGSHLKIFLGDNVTIMRSTIGASKLFDEPVLRIGHNSGVGYGTVISIAKEVIIGDNCMIGSNCIIMDNDDHPISPQKRLARETVRPEDVYPVKIGNNVWIGANCAILKGTHIGDNSIIATHSVISKDVLPNCVYAGYPARPTLRDIDKTEEPKNDAPEA